VLFRSPYAQYTGNIDATLTLLEDIQIYGLIDGEFGRKGRDYNIACRQAQCFFNSYNSLKKDDPLWVASGIYYSTEPFDIRQQDQFDASFLKLREMGLRYTLPSNWVRAFHAERASFSVAGRDLWYLWRAQKQVAGINIPSPEVRDPNGTSNFALFQWPGLTSVTASMKVSF
jgi:hypothetical protein